ncbi:isoaspartyl peptidase/L-asparaginase family protein [Pacificimonas sp. ICDLI1SI03]
MQDWALVVHGGAGMLERGGMTAEHDSGQRAALAAALQAGKAVLQDGGAAVDAVEAAVAVLEDHPGFNAGHGAVLNAEGTVELDAAIMNGADRNAGAVAGVTKTRNPVRLARAVMDHSPHVMLQGNGADIFSEQSGLEQAPNDYFVTAERQEALRRMQEAAAAGDGDGVFDAEVKFGTVGAVARDKAGNLAAATSTGGLTGKRFGRVGDSPIVGAGTYADNRGCAVSATGSGEFYIRANAAAAISAEIRYRSEKLQQAADTVQADIRRMGGAGGVIAVAADGTPVYSFNTPGMYRGMALADGTLTTAIYGDEA